jgi:hypothetical protein
VWLWLPDQSLPVEIEQGVVRWAQGDRFGVSFLKVQLAMQARLVHVSQILDAAQQPRVHVIAVKEGLRAGQTQGAF